MFVFFYGTLRPEASSVRSSVPERSGMIPLGRGRVKGKLYNMGAFPAAVFDPNETKDIVGDVFFVDSASENRILELLDAIEGHPRFYHRKNVDVEGLGQDSLECLAYEGGSWASDGELIESGDWLKVVESLDG